MTSNKDNFPLHYLEQNHERESNIYMNNNQGDVSQNVYATPSYSANDGLTHVEGTYTHLVTSKTGLPEDPPPEYDDIVLSEVKKSRSPNWCLIFKILIAIGAGFVIVIIIYAIIAAIINSGGGGVTTTVTPSSTANPSSPPTSPGVSNPATTTTVTGTQTTTTTTPTTTTVPTTPGTDPPDAWSSWSSWSDCSVTCGDGVHTRDRECPSGVVCEGTDTQTKPCSRRRCPGPDYGEWTSWAPWADCSVSCGGGVQERTRTCQQEPGQEICPGQGSQSRPCNEFDCPSCSDTCPDGGVMDPNDCNRCSCAGQIMGGRVTNEANIAVEHVLVADNRWPNIILSTTDTNGFFSIAEACEGLTLLFSKGEYLDATGVLSPSMSTVIMEKIEYLSISHHPQSKVRVGGESVTLCCTASGNPPPDYFEWFKNGALLDSSLYNYDSEIVFNSLTAEHSGYYRCRANNQYSAIYSKEAHLLVENTANDFCSPQPSPKIISLPRGCKVDGKEEIDVGECNPSTCRFEGDSDNGACKEDVGVYCCGPVTFDTVVVDCSDGMKLPLSFVTGCGCITCPFMNVRIVGVVVSATTNERWPSTDVIINGTVVTRADSKGEFVVSVNVVDNAQVAITIKDLYYTHVDATKNFNLRDAKRGVIITKFRLIPRAPAITIDSTVESEIVLGSIKPFGVLIIPPDSFLTMDGKEYTGNVQASTTVIDPRNISDILASPGSLSFRDDEGLDQQLFTRGMFSLDFASSVDGSQLQLGKEIQVGLDTSLIPQSLLSTNKSLDFLWSLNPDIGYWEANGKLSNDEDTIKSLKQRNLLKNIPFSSIMIGNMTVDINRKWSNFDGLGNTNNWCYSKIRIYTNNTFTEQLQRTVLVTVVVIDGSASDGDQLVGGITESRSMYARPKPDEEDHGYCVFHQCNNPRGNSQRSYEGYIIAEDYSNPDLPQLHPAEFNTGLSEQVKDIVDYFPVVHSENPAISTKFAMQDIPSGEEGPFYDFDGSNVDESDACTSAGEDENHYRFFKEKLPACDDPIEIMRYPACPEVGVNERSVFAWFPESIRQPFPRYGVCFFKVHVINGINETIRIESNMFGFDNPPDGNTFYGSRDRCLSSNEDSVCLELRHPGKTTDCITEYTDILTEISIRHIPGDSGKTCVVEEINNVLELANDEDIIDRGPATFQMNVRDKHYGQDQGIYCESFPNEEYALTRMDSTCSKGEDNNESIFMPLTISNDNWAVKMRCS